MCSSIERPEMARQGLFTLEAPMLLPWASFDAAQTLSTCECNGPSRTYTYAGQMWPTPVYTGHLDRKICGLGFQVPMGHPNKSAASETHRW